MTDSSSDVPFGWRMRRRLSQAQGATTEAMQQTLITQMYVSDPSHQSVGEAVEAIERAIDQHEQVLSQLKNKSSE